MIKCSDYFQIVRVRSQESVKFMPTKNHKEAISCSVKEYKKFMPTKNHKEAIHERLYILSYILKSKNEVYEKVIEFQNRVE